MAGEKTGHSQLEEIRFLHPELPELLAKRDLKIVLFTHRSYFDAEHICTTLVSLGVPIVYCISAREMLMSALRRLYFFQLLFGGLSKRFGVAHVIKHFDIKPTQLTLIDDRPEILKEVLSEGVGLGLHAPFEVRNSSLVTFEFSQVLNILDRKAKSDTTSTIVQLDPVLKSFNELPIITSIASSRASAASLFVRRLVRKTRQLVKKARG